MTAREAVERRSREEADRDGREALERRSREEVDRDDREALEIRIRGRVQGVGFRPTVWRIARELGIAGEVLNDGDGVLIRAAAAPGVLARFIARIADEPPALARIDAIEAHAYAGPISGQLEIAASAAGPVRTQIAPDAAICEACARDIADPTSRRYRYPFTTCTHCGPRLTIITGVPYDRARTTLARFVLCGACAAEYRDPADRRFHAEATACPVCGPRARLVRFDGAQLPAAMVLVDALDAACVLLARGELVAIKGLGGYHIACDATRADSVARLRSAKQRDGKPLAVMARSLDVLRRYCAIDDREACALASPEGPIVLLAADGPETLPDVIAPGLATLGAMLPTTPLHRLILERFDRPLVMTSGNLSDEPPAIDDGDAARRLAAIVDYAVIHDRPIATRVDDSVVRLIDGEIRMVRRARGYAPAPIALPAGFEHAPDLLAYGGDLKAAFCVIQRGEAILSQHQGELDNPATLDDYRHNLAVYRALFEHTPKALVVDRHPGYRATRLARDHAADAGLAVLEIQHHHAHLAACLVDNGRPLDAPPVLGVVLDGVGLGNDGALWGGELLLADYRHARRLATMKPVALLGGDRAAREPWRNLYAQLIGQLGWPAFSQRFESLAIHRQLAAKPRAVLDAMLAGKPDRAITAPLASSCGRLFDAVAAAVGLCFEQQSYEGEAAQRLEAAIDPRALAEDEAEIYPFELARLPNGLPYLEPLAMWSALLGDLANATPTGVIAARFHRGLARGLAQLVGKLARAGGSRGLFDTVALSGGCFANRVLFEELARRLRGNGFRVLAHRRIPTGDGGIALGQAAVCAAQLLDARAHDGLANTTNLGGDARGVVIAAGGG